jgi:hypothetical protein
MMPAKASLLRGNLPKLYLVQFFSSAQFHLVVYTLFLLSKGFSMSQFCLIESAYYLIALLIPMTLALAFALESQFTFDFGFLFIFIQTLASGYFAPLLGDYVNTRIPSAKRATVLSIKNMLFSLLFMTLSPLLGRFIDVFTLPTALLMMALVLTTLGVILFVLYRRQAQYGSSITISNE